MGESVEPGAENVNGSAGQDELMSLMADLKQGVEDMKKGMVDEATVRTIAAQVQSAAKRQRPEGYVPDDVETDEDAAPGRVGRLLGEDRWTAMVRLPPKQIARATRASEEAVRYFQQANDTCLLLAMITKQKPEELSYYSDEYLPAVRQAAMDTKTVGEGKELVRPAELSSSLIERVEGELQVLSLFPSLTMPTSPFRFATKGARRHIATLAEAVEAGTPKAKQLLPGMPTEIQMTAAKFAGEIITSKELEEESAIAILPFLQDELIEWLAWDLEDACINGDAAPPHMDTDTEAAGADDYRKGWNGLRASVPATAKTDAAATATGLSMANIHAARAKMGRYGLKPNGLVALTSVPSLFDLILDPNVMTVDKYGPSATILNGEIAKAWGVPLIASDFIRTDLDATGVNSATPANNVKTIALLVYRGGFMRGIRRNTTVQVLTELYSESDQDAVLVTTRQAFTDKYPADPDVSLIYNIVP